MSIKIISQATSADAAITPSTSDPKVGMGAQQSLNSVEIGNEAQSAPQDKVTLSSQGLELSKAEPTNSYASLSHAELAKKTESILINVGRLTEAQAVLADKEPPNTDGPTRLASAKQADGLPKDSSDQVGVLPKPNVAALESDATLPRAELLAKYQKAMESLRFKTDAEVALANTEVPKSDDPARLAQAKKATDYLYNGGSSPLASLSRNELVAVLYDDFGSYTKNEQFAASKQLNQIDSQFWNPIIDRANKTGDYRALMEASLKAYDSALPIEKMRYPANYKELIQKSIDEDNNKTQAPIDKKQRETLLEMLNALYKKTDQTTSAKGNLRPDQGGYWSAKQAELAAGDKESASADNVK